MDISVSVIIVCMNNLDNLYPCIKSIMKYTQVPYEIIVTAFLFSDEKFKKSKEGLPKRNICGK